MAFIRRTIMRCPIILTLAVLFVSISGIAVEAEKNQGAKSAITDVTIYSDRARVTRKAELLLKQGLAVYSFNKLPGWIDPGSVRAAVNNGSGKIVDVRISKEYLAQSDNEKLQTARDSLQEITDKMNELNDELNILTAEKNQIENIRVFSMEKLPKDAALRDINVGSYGAVVGFVSESLRENAAQRRSVATEMREIQPEHIARSRTLADLEQLTRLEETSITITIEAEKAGSAEMSLTYMLPGATWEPAHELRVAGKKPEKAAMASFAVVTQTTGEDWENARLSFSTQSPREVMQIPELKELLLNSPGAIGQQLAGRVVDSFQQAQSAYNDQQLLWNVQKGNSIAVLKGNWEQQNVVQGRIKRVFETLRKRGTTAHFVGRSRPIIHTDGQSVRVPIGEVTLNTSLKMVSAPQVSLNVVNTLAMLNSGSQPFLPGKVSLYQDDAFIGITDIDFVSESESFSVFLGVADKIKISRVPDRDFCSIQRGKRTRMQVAFDIAVENLSDSKAVIDLTDQIPVSEDKDIEVDKVRIEPDATPDSKGFIKWKISLEPKEKKSMRIEYRIDYSPVAIRARMERKSSLSSPIQQMEVNPSADMQIDLSEKIMDLETSLF